MIQIIEGKNIKSEQKNAFQIKVIHLYPLAQEILVVCVGKKTIHAQESVLLFYVPHPRFTLIAKVKLLNSYLINK